jgi:GGDEF domain-containing protein
VQELIARARALLPGDAALGLTRTEELAILLPGATAEEAARRLRGAIDGIGPTFQLPGGAEVKLRFAAGIAGYPEHASDADSLYMAADSALADAIATDTDLVLSI